MNLKNNIKTQSFDLMQYFFGSVHEPLIRGLIRFTGHLDESTLEKAVDLSVNAIVQIRCIFDPNTHKWKDHGFTAKDMIHTVSVSGAEKEFAEKYLTSSIKFAYEPQLKIFLLQGIEADTLCVIMNHMVCDGTGFKQYLYLLAGLYSKCANDADYSIKPQPADRSAGKLLKGFAFGKKLSILSEKMNFPKQESPLFLPLDGDYGNPFVIKRRVERTPFSELKEYTKSHSVSVNDMLMTAYARTLYKYTKCLRIVFPCPVDLRKYITRRRGICNLTSNYKCNVSIAQNESFEETLRKISFQMNAQKSSKACLKGPILLNLLFHILPFYSLQRLFYSKFTIPVISYSNLGIIDQDLLRFGSNEVSEAYISGAVKYFPYFQVTASTFGGCCTLSSSFHGTERDKKTIEEFLEEMERELFSPAP